MSICLHGGYYYDNFGDLLLFKLYRRWIRAWTTESIVYPLVPGFNRDRFQSHFFGAHTGVTGHRGWRLVLWAGGGHFAQPDLARWSRKWPLHFIRQHYLLAEWCIRKNIPYALLGVGAGPVRDAWLRRAVKRIFEHAAEVSVRDPESQAFLNWDLGIQRTIPVIPDAAVTLSASQIPLRVQKSTVDKLAPFHGKKLLGIHFTESFLDRTPKAVRVRERLVSSLASEEEIQPVVFTDYGQGSDGPVRRFVERIEKATGRPCVSWPFTTVEDLLGLISNFSAVITPKLHVGIAAYALNKYVESFATDMKIPRFYRLIRRPAQCEMLNAVTPAQAGDKIARAIRAARDDWNVADETWLRIKNEGLLHKTMVEGFLESALKEAPIPEIRIRPMEVHDATVSGLETKG